MSLLQVALERSAFNQATSAPLGINKWLDEHYICRGAKIHCVMLSRRRQIYATLNRRAREQMRSRLGDSPIRWKRSRPLSKRSRKLTGQPAITEDLPRQPPDSCGTDECRLAHLRAVLLEMGQWKRSQCKCTLELKSRRQPNKRISDLGRNRNWNSGTYPHSYS
jgi:hypothetical protein